MHVKGWRRRGSLPFITSGHSAGAAELIGLRTWLRTRARTVAFAPVVLQRRVVMASLLASARPSAATMLKQTPTGLRAALPIRRARTVVRVANIAAPAEELMGGQSVVTQPKFEVRALPLSPVPLPRPARRRRSFWGVPCGRGWCKRPRCSAAAAHPAAPSPSAAACPLPLSCCRAGAAWPTPLPSLCKTCAMPSPRRASRRTPSGLRVRPGAGRKGSGRARG